MRQSLRESKAGFTLIEILIVIFIISIVTGVALLTMNHNENRQIESFANEITQFLTLAEEQAMLQPAVLGLFANHSYFYFARYQAAQKNKKSTWIPLDDELLGKHVIPDNISLILKMDGQKKDEEKEEAKHFPQVIISINGDMTPFKMYVGKKGKSPHYLISGDADGSIRNKKIL